MYPTTVVLAESPSTSVKVTLTILPGPLTATVEVVDEHTLALVVTDARGGDTGWQVFLSSPSGENISFTSMIVMGSSSYDIVHGPFITGNKVSVKGDGGRGIYKFLFPIPRDMKGSFTITTLNYGDDMGAAPEGPSGLSGAFAHY